MKIFKSFTKCIINIIDTIIMDVFYSSLSFGLEPGFSFTVRYNFRGGPCDCPPRELNSLPN